MGEIAVEPIQQKNIIKKEAFDAYNILFIACLFHSLPYEQNIYSYWALHFGPLTLNLIDTRQ